MRTRTVLVAVAVLALLGSALPSSAQDGPPQLRREGRWLVDHLGRVVLLHGVNAVWKLPPYCPPDTPEGFRAEDAAWLADHGFNTVRLNTMFVGVMPERDTVDHAYLDCVDRVVDLLAQQGIWVLLDAHQDLYNERFGGAGFPDWSVIDDGLPPQPDAGFPGSYFAMPALQRAFDHLYANDEAIQDSWADAWAAVAARFRGESFFMGYDLFNEPWPGTEWPSCFNLDGCPVHDSVDLQPLMERLLAGIREVDPDNLVWIEPNLTFDFGAANNFGTLRPFPADANLGFSWHNYGCLEALPELREAGYRSLGECEILQSRVFDNAEAVVERIGAATLLSEFGASDNLPDIQRVIELADQHLVSWQYWAYKAWEDPSTTGPGEQSLFADDGDLSTVKVDKLRILERAYPQATAGVPVELSFDPETATMRYVYSPRPAGGPTVVHIPTVHYPDGYTTRVEGASVTSAPNARPLTVEAAPGATEVVIEVTPGASGGQAGTPSPAPASSGPGSGSGGGGAAPTGQGLPATGGGLAAVALMVVAVSLAGAARRPRRR